MKKHIVISANTSWYLINFRANLIRRLLEEDYQVTAVAPKDKYSEQFNKLGCQFYDLKIDQGGTNPIKDFCTLCSFYQLYKKINPNIVLNFTPKNNIYSTLAASYLNIPTVNNIAGLGSVFIKESAVAHIARWMYKISQRRTKHLFFQNEEDKKLFFQKNIAKNIPSTRIPGSGVDLKRFHPTPPPNDGKVRFILIGRMLYEKGVANYVESAGQLRRRYSNIECFLLGFIDDKNPSAIPPEVIKNWHDSGDINYLGASDEVEKEIKNIDVVVLPSYYREGVPRSLLEGAAMARPIITTDNVGCKETVINGVNGFLCEPHNTKSLTEAMEKIILMPRQERLNMGRESRDLVERLFNENIVLNSYLEKIESIIK